MIKKIVFIICVNIILTFSTMAQYGNFSIKVKKVFPSNGVVYENSYNLLDELDKAKMAAINKYKGSKDNYIIEMVTPNGKKVEELQNIKWVMSENGKKTYHHNRPNSKQCYPQKTTVIVYECYNDGSEKGNYKSSEYIYSYKLLINKKEQPYYDINYYTKEEGTKQAQKLLKEKANHNDLYEVVSNYDNEIVATNTDSYNKNICDKTKKRFEQVKLEGDIVFVKFVNEELNGIDCQSVRDSVNNEIERRYKAKLDMADTASYDNKVIYYEQAKVLKPDKKYELDTYIEQVKKNNEEQQFTYTKEKKSWLKRLFKKDKNKKIKDDKKVTNKKDKNKDKNKYKKNKDKKKDKNKKGKKKKSNKE